LETPRQRASVILREISARMLDFSLAGRRLKLGFCSFSAMRVDADQMSTRVA
jgi:hypothetical protein